MQYPEVKIVDNEVIIDEDTINLFQEYEGGFPEWQPTRTLPSFSELKIIYLDIETTGLDPDKDQITMIGVRNELGANRVIVCEDEEAAIRRFLYILENKKPDILAGFNHIEFDLKFIIRRCERLAIKHPFWVKRDRPTIIRTAQKFGVPVEYYSIWLNQDGHHTAIIDMYHQVLMWDFTRAKLTSHSLKQSVLQMGLRDESRTELSYQEMMECWNRRHEDPKWLKLYQEYLVYDLEDTQLLGNYLLPSVYYQKIFLDWKLQSISTAGNASKWNSILQSLYPGYLPVEESKKEFTGGKAAAIAGLYPNVIKIDVSGMYPSIMKRYGITTKKDTKRLMLGVLDYISRERGVLKPIANDQTDRYTEKEKRDADQFQDALKKIGNSCYGFLGTAGIEFNDYAAAAMVTAHGRAILKLMVRSVIDSGGIPLSLDTDGVYAAVPPGKEQEIFEYTKSQLPPNIDIDFEVHAKAFYSPPAGDKAKPDYLVDVLGDAYKPGLRKNYIIFYESGKIKATGKFRKRNFSVLEKNFTIQFLKKYLISPQQAQDYYDHIITMLRYGLYDTSELALTRKISAKEVKLVRQGIGQRGDVVTIYKAKDQPTYSKKTGKMLKNPEKMFTLDPKMCDQSQYIPLVKEQYDNIISAVSSY